MYKIALKGCYSQSINSPLGLKRRAVEQKNRRQSQGSSTGRNDECTVMLDNFLANLKASQ